MELAINLIRTDGGTQPRTELNYDVIQDYAQQMLEGVVFPDVVLFYDGTDHWLADGFHRYHATRQICREIINVEVRQGTRRDAVLYSVGANSSHGLRRTNADKRRAVETLLRDPEWAKWSDYEIARHTATSHEFVRRMKLTSNVVSEERTYTTKYGTVATMNTVNIGGQQPIELQEEQPVSLTLAETQALTSQPGPLYGPAYHSPTLESIQRPESFTPRHVIDEVVPGFVQWQQDNQTIGLDRWAGPLPTSAPPEQPLYEVQREIRREEARERIAQLKAKGVELPVGKYSCLVVDPPWPMQKIERDVRPHQVEFDYPTMTEDELKAFPLPDVAGDDCHLYLWATQKYLPMALRLAEHWGFRYQCLLTWRKNIGFTPFSWMYSTEHVLFCTRGSLPLLRLGVRLDFEAKVREHSRKPDEFYDIVREVSPGPRLDVFSRERRDGFDQYGNEVGKYVSAG